MIPHIEEGMTWQQVFGIINDLITEHNALYGATDGVVVDGHIDYNVITNKPSINGVELVGNKTQADINVQIDSETQTALNTLGGRVSVVEEDLTETVTTEELDTELQPYAKTTDLPDMTGYYTKQQVDTSLGQKVDTSTYNTQMQQMNTAINSKADAGEVPTTAEWQALSAEMDAKVTQAGNSAQAAQTAAASVPANCATRLGALELTVDGDAEHDGLTDRTSNLETKMGTAGDKTSISDDLKETRVKSNDILEALKEVPEVYQKVKDIAALDVNY